MPLIFSKILSPSILPFNSNIFSSEEAHVGHNHGFLGEAIEHLLESAPINDTLKDCIGHIIVDSLNVFFMLFAVMMIVFFISSYIDMDKLHKKLASLKSIWGFVLAIIIGVLSPFCSCSIIPVLMGFLSVGVPVSVCLCYLTASSMINITALLSLSATTGFEFTLIYFICSILIITCISIIFSILKLDNSIGSYHSHSHNEHNHKESFKEKLSSAFSCTLNVFKRSYLFILLGIILSSIIMTYFSIDTLSAIVNEHSGLSTAIVSVVGIPIHSDIFSIAPIINLMLKISPSIALTFTLSTMAISLPSVIILTRALKLKTVLIYCGIIIALIIVTGYVSALFI